MNRAAGYFGAELNAELEMIDLVDGRRDEFGIRPICTVLRSARVKMAFLRDDRFR